MAEYNADAVQAAIDKDKTIGKQEGKAIHALLKGRTKGMTKDQQDAADRARMLAIMFQDSLRVGPFRIAEITSGLTNAKIMAIVKDGDTSPVPATFNTRQAAVNYCVEQIQTGDICYHPCGAY